MSRTTSASKEISWLTRGAIGPNWDIRLLVYLFQKSLGFTSYHFRTSLARSIFESGGWFPIFLTFLKITLKSCSAKVAVKDSGLTFLYHHFWTTPCSSRSEWLSERGCARLARPSISWTRGVHGSASTLSVRDDNHCEHHASADRFLLPASLVPIHNNCVGGESGQGVQTKVFSFPFSDLLSGFLFYFKISHFHKEWIQRILLARKIWRGKPEVRGLSQHGSPP